MKLKNKIRLSKLLFHENHYSEYGELKKSTTPNGWQKFFIFKNGYMASVVAHDSLNGFELALMDGRRNITQHPDITDNIIGFTNIDTGTALLQKIAELPNEVLMPDPESFNKYKTLEINSNCCFTSVGYRCSTSQTLRENKLIKGETSVFDWGFFTPQGIASILKNGNMELSLDDKKEPMNFSFCENIHNQHARVFKTISEKEIDKQFNIQHYSDRFLDSSAGYYTLLKDHNIILAHYLWHKSSDDYETDYRNVVDKVSKMFARRLERLNNICSSNKKKFFIHYHDGPYNSIEIDGNKYDLTDMDILKNQLDESFGENTLLCFSNFEKKDRNNIFYFKHTEYENFCKYAYSKMQEN